MQALHAECSLEPSTGNTDASAEISGANLLGGVIRLTDIETSCVATENGLVGSSRVGTLNGQPIGTPPTTISIPSWRPCISPDGERLPPRFLIDPDGRFGPSRARARVKFVRMSMGPG